MVEYEPDPDLRDTELMPLKEPGGIEAFIRREVLPHAPDAWIDETKTAIGYEISFTRYFYKPQPLRPLEAIRADILALERETEGLMAQIVGAAGMIDALEAVSGDEADSGLPWLRRRARTLGGCADCGHWNSVQRQWGQQGR